MSPMPPAITSGNSPAPSSKRASHQPALLLSNRTDSAPLMPCAVAFDYLAQTQSRQIRDEAWAKRRQPLARSQSLKAPALPLTLRLSGANLGDGLPVIQNALYPLGRLSDDRLAQFARERLQVIIWEGTCPGERCRQRRWECTGSHLAGQQDSEQL